MKQKKSLKKKREREMNIVDRSIGQEIVTNKCACATCGTQVKVAW